jgi:hypothetical protein
MNIDNKHNLDNKNIEKTSHTWESVSFDCSIQGINTLNKEIENFYNKNFQLFSNKSINLETFEHNNIDILILKKESLGLFSYQLKTSTFNLIGIGLIKIHIKSLNLKLFSL